MARQPRDAATGQTAEAEADRPDEARAQPDKPAPTARILKRNELETLRSRLQKKFH